MKSNLNKHIWQIWKQKRLKLEIRRYYSAVSSQLYFHLPILLCCSSIVALCKPSKCNKKLIAGNHLVSNKKTCSGFCSGFCPGFRLHKKAKFELAYMILQLKCSDANVLGLQKAKEWRSCVFEAALWPRSGMSATKFMLLQIHKLQWQEHLFSQTAAACLPHHEPCCSAMPDMAWDLWSLEEGNGAYKDPTATANWLLEGATSVPMLQTQQLALRTR